MENKSPRPKAATLSTVARSAETASTDALQRAATLLEDVAKEGARLWVEDGRLRCSAPAGMPMEELRLRLSEQREALLALLSRVSQFNPSPNDGTTWREGLPSGHPPTLTLAQQSLLPLARERANHAVYNVPLLLEVHGPFSRMALHTALHQLLVRHDSLRTCFPDGCASPVLRPHAAGVTVEEIGNLSGGNAKATIQRAIARPFNLSQGPLWRYCVFGLGKNRTILVFVFHHLIFDGFSRDVFLRELLQLYDAEQTGEVADMPPPIQSSDFAVWERVRCSQARTDSARSWWWQRFGETCPSTALPPGVAGQKARSGHVEVPAQIAAALFSRAREAHLPPAALAIASGLLALRRITGQNSILAMTPLANRDHPESQRVIGYLNRVIPLLVRVRPEESPAIFTARLARDLLEASAHSHLATEEIAGLPGLARNQLNRLLVSWQERRRDELRFAGVPARELPSMRADADFCLALQFEADGDRLTCRLDSASNVLGMDGQTAFARLLVCSIEVMAGSGWHQSIHEALPQLVDIDLFAELLESHPGVDEAVAAIDPDAGGVNVWVVLNESEIVSDASLHEWLSARLDQPMPPIRMTTRAVLPRTSSGEVDLSALRSPAAVDALEIEPPRGELERLVAEIWQKVLWLDRPVGRNEDFRTLGGHSLLAVRMVSEVEAALERPLGPRAIMKLSSVADFAAALENPDSESTPVDSILDPTILSRLLTYTASWAGVRPFEGALVVGRNLRGARVPLFWCLQSETELNQLARYLGDDQPVFGMRSGHAVMVKSRENIVRLAKHYTDEILRVCAGGPIFLGGNCQAAVIAFHIAKQLEAAGREPALLILHEKMVPEPYAGRIALSFGRDSDRNPYLTASDPRADFRVYYSGPFSIDLVSGSHGLFFKEPHIRELVSMIAHRRDGTPLLAGLNQQSRH